MKKICFLITIFLVFSLNIVCASENKFIDVGNHWAKENINRMVANSKINGYPDGTFRPNNEVTTLEFIKIILSTLNIELVKFDMSEYMDKTSVNKLIGASSGYVGYEEGGMLVDSIRKNPHCVLLLDEIEKAHPDVFNILSITPTCPTFFNMT